MIDRPDNECTEIEEPDADERTLTRTPDSLWRTS